MTHFIVARKADAEEYETKDLAINAAKREVSGSASKRPRFVYQAVASVEAPVPEAIVTDIN